MGTSTCRSPTLFRMESDIRSWTTKSKHSALPNRMFRLALPTHVAQALCFSLAVVTTTGLLFSVSVISQVACLSLDIRKAYTLANDNAIDVVAL